MDNQGGKRPGAGRPKGAIARVRGNVAERVLESVDEDAIWKDILDNGDLKLKFDAMKYLTDRRDGKAIQVTESIDTGSSFGLGDSPRPEINHAASRFSTSGDV
jgi:hypothetical protein